MQEVIFELNKSGEGAFFLEAEGIRAGEMIISIHGKILTVYHTEVLPEFEGKGLAKKLISAMVGYARAHELKVIPLCPYTLSVFNKNLQKYEDV